MGSAAPEMLGNSLNVSSSCSSSGGSGSSSDKRLQTSAQGKTKAPCSSSQLRLFDSSCMMTLPVFMDALLVRTLQRCNVRLRSDVCCPLHGVMEAVKENLARIEKFNCMADFSVAKGMQCMTCGVISDSGAEGRCPMCLSSAYQRVGLVNL